MNIPEHIYKKFERVYSHAEYLNNAMDFASYQADAEERIEAYRTYIKLLEEENERLNALVKSSNN